MVSSQLPLSDEEKSALEEPPSNAPSKSIVVRSIVKLFYFGRSIFAEWVVYALVYSSMGAIVTFFLLLPIDFTHALMNGGYEQPRLIRFHVIFFYFPTGYFKLEAFSLGTWTLLIGLWLFTVRPSLALAGWIVKKRFPAYTLPAEKYPPIRWGFEYLCCVANEHHLFIPDPEFYARRAIRLISSRVSSDSYQLGSISPEEYDELRIFAHTYLTVMEQYLAEEFPTLPIPAIKYGEGAHSVCAGRVLSQVEEGTPSSTSWRMRIRWEYSFFWRMYVFVLGYWMFRVMGELSVLVQPYCENGTACVEEWYEKYAVLAPPV